MFFYQVISKKNNNKIHKHIDKNVKGGHKTSKKYLQKLFLSGKARKERKREGKKEIRKERKRKKRERRKREREKGKKCCCSEKSLASL